MVFQEWLCWLKKGIFGYFCEKVVNYLDIFLTYISFQSFNSELNQLHKLSPRNKSRHGWLDQSDGSAFLRSRGADRRGQMSWDIWKSQHFLVRSFRDDSSLNWDRGLVVWLRICDAYVWLSSIAWSGLLAVALRCSRKCSKWSKSQAKWKEPASADRRPVWKLPSQRTLGSSSYVALRMILTTVRFCDLVYESPFNTVPK